MLNLVTIYIQLFCVVRTPKIWAILPIMFIGWFLLAIYMEIKRDINRRNKDRIKNLEE